MGKRNRTCSLACCTAVAAVCLAGVAGSFLPATTTSWSRRSPCASPSSFGASARPCRRDRFRTASTAASSALPSPSSSSSSSDPSSLQAFTASSGNSTVLAATPAAVPIAPAREVVAATATAAAKEKVSSRKLERLLNALPRMRFGRGLAVSGTNDDDLDRTILSTAIPSVRTNAIGSPCPSVKEPSWKEMDCSCSSPSLHFLFPHLNPSKR